MKKNYILKYLLIILSVISITACNKDESKNNEPTKAADTPVPTDTAGTLTTAPNPDITGKPDITGEPDITKNPDITDNPEVTTKPDKDDISSQAALDILYALISEAKYTIKLYNESLTIDGKNYYVFKVSQGNEVIDPLIIVNKKDASVYYYEGNNQIINFTYFPMDKVETLIPDDNIEASDAASKIAALPKEKLSLNKPFNEYETETDPWTTVVNGEQCYGVDVFDTSGGNRQLTAVFYVSVDGDNIYRLEDDNNFIKISD